MYLTSNMVSNAHFSTLEFWKRNGLLGMTLCDLEASTGDFNYHISTLRSRLQPVNSNDAGCPLEFVEGDVTYHMTYDNLNRNLTCHKEDELQYILSYTGDDPKYTKSRGPTSHHDIEYDEFNRLKTIRFLNARSDRYYPTDYTANAESISYKTGSTLSFIYDIYGNRVSTVTANGIVDTSSFIDNGNGSLVITQNSKEVCTIPYTSTYINVAHLMDFLNIPLTLIKHDEELQYVRDIRIVVIAIYARLLEVVGLDTFIQFSNGMLAPHGVKPNPFQQTLPLAAANHFDEMFSIYVSNR